MGLTPPSCPRYSQHTILLLVSTCPHYLSFLLAIRNLALANTPLEVLRCIPSPSAPPLLLALPRTPPGWCLASLPQTGQVCQRYSHPFPLFPGLAPSSRSCVFSISVAVPDLSDRRLVRVISAAPPPFPQSPSGLALRRSSGLSDRRLVRIVRLLPSNN